MCSGSKLKLILPTLAPADDVTDDEKKKLYKYKSLLEPPFWLYLMCILNIFIVSIQNFIVADIHCCLC